MDAPCDFAVLPDYLAPKMPLVFIGINPSTYSAAQGHYFARRTNRFWPALSQSRLSEPIRAALGRDRLEPTDDARLLAFGIGFTDLVKRPSARAAELSRADYRIWAPKLRQRLEHYQPRVACFHGFTGYRAFVRDALGLTEVPRNLGPQPHSLGPTRLYVVPNPSPANAHFTLADQIAWYDRLADFLAEIGAPIGRFREP